MLSIWDKIAGNKDDFSAEHRAYNTISIVTLAILCVLLPFNLMIGLVPISTMMGILIVLISGFYYISRVLQKFYVSITLYAIVSYAVLILTYYFNAGINGPTLLLFFLTFMLLIAFTPRKQHPVWGLAHTVIGGLLVYAEEIWPGWIVNVYENDAHRYLDFASSYIVTLGLVYFATIYLRNSYDREKKLSDRREKSIIAQNKQLEQINQEKNKLFSIIAHDLRSPITSIKGYLQMVSNQNLSADERAFWETELLQHTDRTLEMLSNILSWSKSQMDGKEVKLKPLNLHHTLQSTVEIQKAIGAGKGVSIHYYPDIAVNVMADPDMLQLVVRNLISNSIKFTDAGGDVNINIRTKENNCIIAIKDNGIGMPHELQKQIFSLNIQSTVGTMNEKGVGLGLALCKEYIELQNGTIWFESIANAGSIFYLSLPLAAEPKPAIVKSTQIK